MNPIPVTILRGIGEKCAQRLSQLAINSLQDLLLHLPIRYEDRSTIQSIVTVKPGDRAFVEGRIESLHYAGKQQYLKCVLRDASHQTITLIFFMVFPKGYC